jgi:hypothetical protein
MKITKEIATILVAGAMSQKSFADKLATLIMANERLVNALFSDLPNVSLEELKNKKHFEEGVTPLEVLRVYYADDFRVMVEIKESVTRFFKTKEEADRALNCYGGYSRKDENYVFPKELIITTTISYE